MHNVTPGFEVGSKVTFTHAVLGVVTGKVLRTFGNQKVQVEAKVGAARKAFNVPAASLTLVSQ